MRYRQARSGLLLGSAVAGVAVLASCAATAGPAPFSASPVPALTPSVVASIPASSPAPVPAQSSVPATTTATATPPKATTATSSAKPNASTAPGGLRTSYPGIKKLVIIKSRWNATPAGRAAIDTVAAYTSALVRATVTRSVSSARSRASKSCVQCNADITRISGYVRAGQRVLSATGQPYDIEVATIYVSGIDERGQASVVFTASYPALSLKAADGVKIGSQGASYAAERETVDSDAEIPAITDITFT